MKDDISPVEAAAPQSEASSPSLRRRLFLYGAVFIGPGTLLAVWLTEMWASNLASPTLVVSPDPEAAVTAYGIALLAIIAVLAALGALAPRLQAWFPGRAKIIKAGLVIASLLAVGMIGHYATARVYFNTPDVAVGWALLFTVLAAGVVVASRWRPRQEMKLVTLSGLSLVALLTIQLTMVVVMGKVNILGAEMVQVASAIGADFDGWRAHEGAEPYEAKQLRERLASMSQQAQAQWVAHSVLLKLEGTHENRFHPEKWLELHRVATAALNGHDFYQYQQGATGNGPGVTLVNVEGRRLYEECLGSYHPSSTMTVMLSVISDSRYPGRTPACRRYVGWVVYSAKPEDFAYMTVDQWREKNAPAA